MMKFSFAARVLRPQYVGAWMAAQMMGLPDRDREMDMMMQGLAHWMQARRQARKSRAPLCLSCNHAFTRQAKQPSAFLMCIVTDNHTGKYDNVLTTAICSTCSRRTDEDLLRYWTRECVPKLLGPEGPDRSAIKQIGPYGDRDRLDS